MTPVFKPGDRVRVTEACETVKMRGLFEIALGGPNVNVRLDNGSRAMFMPDELEPAPASSPDTTEAGAAGERDALREELAAAIGPSFKGDSAAVAAILPIIDRHTAKALETALRERP